MTQSPTGTATFQIRPASADDIRRVARLWEEAFPGGRSLGDRIRMLEVGGTYGGLETVLVAEGPGGGVVGACKTFRFTEYIAGTPLPMMGLAAVAVIPSHRRRGIAARLCTAAINAAADRGDVISVLYPFRADYYERLGWGLVGALHQYRFPTASLRVDDAGSVRSAEGGADIGAMAACYGRLAARSTGPIERDRRAWAYRLADETVGVGPVEAEAVWTGRAEARLDTVVHDDDGVSGYALLEPAENASENASGNASDGAVLRVRELVADNDAAYRGLLGHIAARHDRWPVCEYTARPDERFGDFLRDPRSADAPDSDSLYFPTARVLRGPMLRILDVPRAFEARPFFDAGGATAASLAVTVSDPQRPANDGTWTVHVDADGSARVEAGAPEAIDTADAALDTDIASLSRVFAGEVAPTAVAGQGRARVGGDADLLDRAFATGQRFWLLDEF